MLTSLYSECAAACCATGQQQQVTFDKLTHQDFPGTVYYTIRNVSLYECQGWCREESQCVAAAFRFVVNPLAPVQDTSCQLHNTSHGLKPGASPQRAVNTYFLTKVHIRGENVCPRLWSFERVPNRQIRGLDNAVIFTSNKAACLAACLNEVRFVCRSVEFHYVALECRLSEFDRRGPGLRVALAEAPGVDYFENACLQPDQICPGSRNFGYTQVGLSQATLTHFVDLNYYLDKQIMVSSRQECLRHCALEKEFLCHSILYRPGSGGGAACKLYHVDHLAFPDGAETFATPNPLPLLDSGESSGTYLENVCGNDTEPPAAPSQQIQTKEQPPPLPLPPVPKPSIQKLPATSDIVRDPSCDAYGVCYDVSIQCTDNRMVVFVRTNRPFYGRIYALGRSETCHANVLNSQQFRLDLSLGGQDCNTQSLSDVQGGVYTNTVVLQHHNVVLTRADKVYNVRCTYEIASRNVSFGMIPIRDPETVQVTATPETPLPKITILGADAREASTVRIGDKLTFRIEIPEGSPYRIFARSCVAMAKDARSTFEVIDEKGCPVEPSIFPRFVQNNNALESTYEAFRFTESYGVIFQCNVKYCIGRCEPAVCGGGPSGRERVESYGRRRRHAADEQNSSTGGGGGEMTLSREILVLDFKDETSSRSLRDRSHSADESYTVRESVSLLETCASRSSVLALSLTTALLLIVYLATVAYFLSQRRILKELS